MGDAAKKDEAETVELPADAFERMLAELARHNDLAAQQTKLLAQIVQAEERKLAQVEDNARRALRKTGPTTDEARATIERMRGKLKL